MDTFQEFEPRLHIAVFKKLFFLLSFFLLASSSTLVHSKLMKFEFAGQGELYDQYFNPIDNGKSISMNVNFIIDTNSLSSKNTGNINGQLANFSYLSLVTGFGLSVDDIHKSGEHFSSSFDGIAVSGLLDFWENSFSVDLGGTIFSVFQWTRFGGVGSEGFLDGESKLQEYYSEMIGTVNGEWLFEKSSNEIFRGALTSFSIYTIPEPNILLLLITGLIGVTSVRRRVL